ncbi:MAG TPA: branched-chain amino acid ABC transporter ATP-binding protein/permease [Acetobacteraceae bacterium]|nr:branched-chain amino acid ABC transporter ATP-binding protein/permease [Acetobacteraceae bacterium]
MDGATAPPSAALARIPAARWWRGLPGALIGLAVACALAAIAPDQGYYLNIIMQAVTYAIGVAGLVVVLGYCGQISLTQAGFLGIGAYVLALMTTRLGVPFLVAVPAAMLVCGAFGLLLGFASLRLGGHYLAMVTISFQVILTLVLTNWIGLTGGPDGVSGIPRPAGLAGARAYLGLCLVLLVLVMFYAWRLKLSRLGRAMQAVRDNEIAAGTCGIHVFRTKVVAFGISALLGGLGGALFAGAFSYVSPDQFTFDESVVMLTMALLGGVQSPFGALLGTFALVILPEWLRFLKQAYLAVYGGAVILLMIFMPEGAWGWAVHRFWRASRPIGDWPVPPLPLLSMQGAGPGAPALEVENLAMHFGGVKALDGVSFAVRRGSVHALIGPNGSGKTTFLNVVSGLYRATSGTVRLGGVTLDRLAPHERTRRGMTRTYQNIRVFRGLTVLENVMIGAERRGNDVQEPAAVIARALAALDFVGLGREASLPVGSLPYGHQRYVEIARALAGSPDILLLDEPAAGLNSTEKQELGLLLRRLKGHGLTILVIEHDMKLIEAVADHITVLNFGKCIADGSPREVLSQPDVIAAYLGEPQPA